MDEDWRPQDPANCSAVIERLSTSPLKADLFTFAERYRESMSQHPYPFEWDNVAAAQTTSYATWWERLPQESRKNVRRAARSGVIVREVSFDATLVQGIWQIYNADQLRQNGAFWHYGKDIDQVRKENSTYLDEKSFAGRFPG